MDRTVNERLLEQLIRAPRAVRKAAMGAGFGEGRPEGHRHGHEGGHHGCHRRGCGMEEGGRGPMHGHGPENGHGHMQKQHRAFGRERLLTLIGSFEGGVRQKTLTERLRINPSSVSELISKLENDGYVRRTVDPSDKRATLITLTELGEARTAELADERNERLDRAFAALTDAEKEQLIGLLRKLNEAAWGGDAEE